MMATYLMMVMTPQRRRRTHLRRRIPWQMTATLRASLNLRWETLLCMEGGGFGCGVSARRLISHPHLEM